MDRYVLFVNTYEDYLGFPLKAYIGLIYASATTIDLYFEKAPLSYKVTLTIETGTGVQVAQKIQELFSKYTGSQIIFDEINNKFPISEITAISSFTKVVIK